MPAAHLRLRSCGCLAPAGVRCPHDVKQEKARGSASARGYGVEWERFRKSFRAHLLAHGIVPACGARWPGLPATGDSRCQAEGRLNVDRLQLDHTPPLSLAERAFPHLVCDYRRVQYLCFDDHVAKTRRESAS